MNDNNQAPAADAGARDDPLPQDRAWIIPKAVGLMAAYRDCKWPHESKAVLDEFVEFMRAAVATTPMGEAMMGVLNEILDHCDVPANEYSRGRIASIAVRELKRAAATKQ